MLDNIIAVIFILLVLPPLGLIYLTILRFILEKTNIFLEKWSK